MKPAHDLLAERQRLLVTSAAVQRALVAREWQALRGQTRPAALLATLWQRASPRGIGVLGAVLALAALAAARRRRTMGTGTGLALALTLARLGLAVIGRRRRE